jgi:hypothetical protein
MEPHVLKLLDQRDLLYALIKQESVDCFVALLELACLWYVVHTGPLFPDGLWFLLHKGGIWERCFLLFGLRSVGEDFRLYLRFCGWFKLHFRIQSLLVFVHRHFVVVAWVGKSLRFLNLWDVPVTINHSQIFTEGVVVTWERTLTFMLLL